MTTNENRQTYSQSKFKQGWAPLDYERARVFPFIRKGKSINAGTIAMQVKQMAWQNDHIAREALNQFASRGFNAETPAESQPAISRELWSLKKFLRQPITRRSITL